MARRKLEPDSDAFTLTEEVPPKVPRVSGGGDFRPRVRTCDKEELKTQKMHLFFGNSIDPRLAAGVAADLGMESSIIDIKKFNDGEVSVTILDSVRHKHCYVLQSTAHVGDNSVNDSLMELILTIDALQRSSAKSITAVIPYYGYARQDRKTRSRVPISASAVAKMIQNAGASRIVAVDLHCGQIQGFFEIPVDNLYASVAFVPILSDVLSKSSNGKLTIVSPDAGGVERVLQFIKGLSVHGLTCNLAMIIKRRDVPGSISGMDLVGAPDVIDADCVIVDDIADTCGTLIRAVKELKKAGARRVFAAVTHPVFSKDAVERIEECQELEQMFVSDSIPPARQSSKISVVSVASIIAIAISRNYTGGSISAVFDFEKSRQLSTPAKPFLSPSTLLGV